MNVIDEITRERRRQDEQWGGAEHDDRLDLGSWIAVVTKHLGMFAEAALVNDVETMRKKTITCAALFVALAESIDRRRV